MSDLKIPTSKREIIAARIVPKSSCYVIEIVYERRSETTDKQQIAGVDLGVNNLITQNNQPSSKRLIFLTHKRNCRGENYLHTASKKVIDWCIRPQIGTLIIGHNEWMKQSLNLGKRNHQQLVNIPHYRLIEMLTYKAQLKGIKVIITEESYTSQSSALDRDELPKYGEEKPLFKGKRLARGLDKMGKNQLLNADVNGAFNIIRKVITDVIEQGIRGLPFNTLRA